MTQQIPARPEPQMYLLEGAATTESSLAKYGGWIIVIGSFLLAACLLFAVVVASSAGGAVDQALWTATANDDLGGASVAGTQRNTTVIVGLVNIGSGNTKQSSVTTTTQHRTMISNDTPDPWAAIFVVSLGVLFAVVAVLTAFRTPETSS